MIPHETLPRALGKTIGCAAMAIVLGFWIILIATMFGRLWQWCWAFWGRYLE